MTDYEEIDLLASHLSRTISDGFAFARHEGEEHAWRIAIAIVKNHMLISDGRRDIDALRDILEKFEDRLENV